MGNTTSVIDPRTVPSSSRASSRWQHSDSTIAVSAAASGGGDELDSCGIRRAIAATSSSSTAVQVSIRMGADATAGTGVGRNPRGASEGTIGARWDLGSSPVG
jgi:hypothetical protein